MPAEPDRRTRKRLATRQLISDAATRLFFELGFDRVTVEQIAAAADVGRMTVFNHFPRKEDMFFDREQDAEALVFAAVRERAAGTAPVEALRLLAHRLVREPHPLLPLFDGTRRFVLTALASEALKARARQMRGAFELRLGDVLAGSVARPVGDPDARLAAGLVVASWSVAFAEAQRVGLAGGDKDAVGRVFLGLVDRGSAATVAALAGTPYG